MCRQARPSSERDVAASYAELSSSQDQRQGSFRVGVGLFAERMSSVRARKPGVRLRAGHAKAGEFASAMFRRPLTKSGSNEGVCRGG